MSKAEPQWQSHLYAILPHPSEPSMLMVLEEAGWSLPCVRLDEHIWRANWSRINEAMQQKLGNHITVLRYLSFEEEHSSHQIHGIFVLENHHSAAVAPQGTWIKHAAIADLVLALPEQKPTIEDYLLEINQATIPDLRPPWAQPGWFDAAATWIKEQLAAQGYTLSAPIEYVKKWGISCILRASSTAGDFYFKEASGRALFADEPTLIKGLAALFPDHIPLPLSIDQKRRWMLLADFGQSVQQLGKDTVQDEIFTLFARMQIKSTEHIADLIELGCLDRRLDQLAAQIEPLLKDQVALAGLAATEIERVRLLGPQLKEMCTKLSDNRVPQTLVHGDLHLGNIALHKGKYLIFDWTDGCISHPFLDMISVYFDESDQSKKIHFRDTYLALWTRYEPMERLLEAWALAEPLSALHQIISYQYIVASLEPSSKQELDGALAHFLRLLLQAVDKLHLTIH